MSSSFATEPTWEWPESTNSAPQSESQGAAARGESPDDANSSQSQGHSSQQPKPTRSRRYLPRTCRICLETVLPTFEPTSDSYTRVLSPSPSVQYISSDPTSGRLIRPCKCRGSSKYVHEGCLQFWRHADPDYGKRNYWQCPTCGFNYRLERMRWAAWISGTGK
jgi:hypothetical protein